MLHVGHAGSVGNIINDGVLRELRVRIAQHRLRLSRAKASFTLHSACTMFPVVEEFTLGVATGGGEQVENVLQEFADGLTKVCYSHTTADAVTRAANFVELKVRARWTPFLSRHGKPR